MSIKSPFPGLDPFLQKHWGDVHHSLIQYTRDALQEELPDGLISRVGERVFVEEFGSRIRSIIPDTHIVEWRRHGPRRESEQAGGVAVAESRVFYLPDDEVTEGFIEIREAGGDQVVTVIEYLSPTNKAGGVGTEKYREKQEQLLQSKTNLVEIDLVRGGRRVLSLDEASIPEEWRNDSLALVRRAHEGKRIELFHMPLRQRLPAIPIPLRPDDEPIMLDLQAIHDECYRKGRYDRLDYSEPLTPPLMPDDDGWALNIASSRLRRT